MQPVAKTSSVEITRRSARDFRLGLANAVSLRRTDNVGRLLLRLTVGGLMLFHGAGKLFNGIEAIRVSVALMGWPDFISYGVYVGEVIGPLMIILGLRTRLGAVAVAGDMIFAVALMHQATFFTLAKSGGWAMELQAFYFFGAVALMFIGGGRYGMVRNPGRWD